MNSLCKGTWGGKLKTVLLIAEMHLATVLHELSSFEIINRIRLITWNKEK